MSETSDIVKQKNIKRGYIKATLTRLATFSKQNLSSCSKDELLVIKQRLTEAFSEYEELNQDLLYLNPNDDENIVLVEETYYQTLTCFNQTLTTLNSGNLQEPTAYNTTAQCSQRTKLPAINVLRHSNKSLDTVQKFYYLRSFLQEEPLNLIKNLPITGDSYNVALELLNNRYNNKQRIINEHIGRLLDLKPLTKSTACNLREFIATVRQELAALKNQESNVKYWDAILLCVLSRKLDGYTARAYQLERNQDADPAVEEFLKYLERRALALESAEPSQNAQHTSMDNRASTTKSRPMAATHVVTGTQCSHYAVAPDGADKDRASRAASEPSPAAEHRVGATV
ncbi:uncharacterized protein LOC105388188 [Plutella xylostella]|uniref:uncharacterized protein LOC105388188 n=1 Tax=Plutella xylostella TaxID=51655 RepID=UPI002032D5EE|nr:uncharacterized protein LOC105388188 [Plutella xylostella]